MLFFLSEINNFIDPIVKFFGEGFEWLSEISVGSVVVRLIMSIICGGLLGVE